jgi:hypothetical protein
MTVLIDLLHHIALLYISLNSFLAGLEGAPFLNYVKGCTHVHEKSLACACVSDGDAKPCVFPDGSLETLVTFESGNRSLDGILFWHVEYRRVFL